MLLKLFSGVRDLTIPIEIGRHRSRLAERVRARHMGLIVPAILLNERRRGFAREFHQPLGERSLQPFETPKNHLGGWWIYQMQFLTEKRVDGQAELGRNFR